MQQLPIWHTESRESDESLDDSGYVMELVTATGAIQLCDTDANPYCINGLDTKRYSSGSWTATTDIQVPCLRRGRVGVKIQTDGATPFRANAIAIGDCILRSDRTQGYADEWGNNSSDVWSANQIPDTLTEKNWLVGVAKEALATTAEENTNGPGTKKILVDLSIGGSSLA
jgi:hypothetical protein